MTESTRIKSIAKQINLRIVSNNAGFQYHKYQRLVVSTVSGKAIIPFEKILYVKAEGNYSHIVTVEGDNFFVSQTLKSIENNLNEIFFRVHQSFTVNLLSISSFESKTSSLTLIDGSKIGVARSRKSTFVKLFS